MVWPEVWPEAAYPDFSDTHDCATILEVSWISPRETLGTLGCARTVYDLTQTQLIDDVSRGYQRTLGIS